MIKDFLLWGYYVWRVTLLKKLISKLFTLSNIEQKIKETCSGDEIYSGWANKFGCIPTTNFSIPVDIYGLSGVITNDIGGAKAGFTTNVYLYNSAYGVLLSGNTYAQNYCTDLSESTTPDPFAFYASDPMKRPQLVEQSNRTQASPMAYGLMNGCDVYFDYNKDTGVTVLGYGNDGNVTYLIGPSGTKVATYQDGTTRTPGVIGAMESK